MRAPVIAVTLAFASVTLLVSCGGSLKSVGGAEKFTDPAYWSQAEALYGEYGGFYELKERSTRVEYEGGNWITTTDHHSVIVVLDANKMEEYADVSIPYGSVSEITKVEARTITADGRMTEVKETYEKSAVPGFMLFSERREKVFAMPRFQDRCVLDISYQMRYYAPDLDDGFWFGAMIPVKKAVYSYTASNSLIRYCDIKYKCYNFPSQTPETQSLDTAYDAVHRFTWEREDIEAYPYEEYMPPIENYMPRMQVTGALKESPYPGWNAVTKWYSDLLRGHCDLPEEFRRELAEAASGAESDREIVEAVRDLISKDFRYVAVSMRDTRWKPHKPEDVCENRYGDCKDLSMLTICAMREEGVEAYPALVLTRDEGAIDRGVVVPHFNHMIIYVEGLDLWLDPTLGAVPLGTLHPNERGVEALIIKGPDAEWRWTPEESDVPAMKRAETLITLMEDGSMMGNSRFLYEGDLALSRVSSYKNMTEEELRGALERAAKGYIRGAALQSCMLTDIESSPPCINAAASFNKQAAAVIIEDRMAVRLDFLEPSLLRLADEFASTGERKYEVLFSYTWKEEETICIDVPTGWEIDRVPDSAEGSARYGTYSVMYSHTPRQVTVTRRFSLDRKAVGLKGISTFVDFWTEARGMAGREIILRKVGT